MYIHEAVSNEVLVFDRVGCRNFTSTSGPKQPPPPPPPPPPSSSLSIPLHPSPDIWIESLRSTLLFSSAQLLERWAPLWRSSTHRGCCLGSSPKEARTHCSRRSPAARKGDTAQPGLCPPLPGTQNCCVLHPHLQGFYASLDASAPPSVALPPAPYQTDAPARLQHRSTFLWTGLHPKGEGELF